MDSALVRVQLCVCESGLPDPRSGLILGDFDYSILWFLEKGWSVSGAIAGTLFLLFLWI
jgi:hypothetical protein